MSESSSDGLRYSFLFLFLMGFRWSGLRETLPPAGTFSTPMLLLRRGERKMSLCTWSEARKHSSGAHTCQWWGLCGALLCRSAELWDYGSVVLDQRGLQLWSAPTSLAPGPRPSQSWQEPTHLSQTGLQVKTRPSASLLNILWLFKVSQLDFKWSERSFKIKEICSCNLFTCKEKLCYSWCNYHSFMLNTHTHTLMTEPMLFSTSNKSAGCLNTFNTRTSLTHCYIWNITHGIKAALVIKYVLKYNKHMWLSSIKICYPRGDRFQTVFCSVCAKCKWFTRVQYLCVCAWYYYDLT